MSAIGLQQAGNDQATLQPRLTPPATPAQMVVRTRLHRRLDRALGGGAVLLSAGAGYGKTTLLASWSASVADSAGVAWLTLEPRHKDPVLLAEHLRLAVAPLLELPPAAGVGGLAAALAERAAESKRRIVVILDDTHRLEAAEGFAPFGKLLEEGSEYLTIVMSGRRDPPLAWPLLRARGGLVELGAADLAFGEEEARAVLARTFGLELPPARIAELCKTTEGWPAGICLGGVAMRDTPDQRGKTGDWFRLSRFTRALIEAEILAQLPADLVTFLEDTSVVERLEPELCDHLSGRTDSLEILRGLVADRLFIEEVPADLPTFRFHAIMSEVLRARLREDRADREAELLAAASAWYEDHGVLDAAIDYALEAGEVGRAVRLIRTASGWALRRGLLETLAGWIQSLPPTELVTHPDLLLALGRACGLYGDLVGARATLEAASEQVASRPEVATPGLMTGIAHLEVSVLVWEGRLLSAEDAVKRFIDCFEASPNDPVLETLSIDREAVYATAALVSLGTGRFQDALERAGAAIEIERIVKPTRYTLGAVAVQALAHAWAGDELYAQRTVAAGHRVRSRFEGTHLEFYEIAEAWLTSTYPSQIRAQAEGGVPSAQALASLAMAKNCLNRDRAAEAADWLTVAEQALDAVPEPAFLEVLPRAIRAEIASPNGEEGTVPLSRREIEVLEAIAGGASRAEAGRELHLSVNTIKTYLRTAYRKLGATSREEALARARSRGVLSAEDAHDASEGAPELLLGLDRGA